MNVKNINDFLENIDKREINEWIVEDDCHSKIKKVKMIAKWVLTEREEVETLQITLEQNRHQNTKIRREINPRQHWVVPNKAVKAEYNMKECETGTLPQKVKAGLSLELDEPIYDGRNYYKDGEKYRT